jgi:hypothetical protein
MLELTNIDCTVSTKNTLVVSPFAVLCCEVEEEVTLLGSISLTDGPFELDVGRRPLFAIYATFATAFGVLAVFMWFQRFLDHEIAQYLALFYFSACFSMLMNLIPQSDLSTAGKLSPGGSVSRFLANSAVMFPRVFSLVPFLQILIMVGGAGGGVKGGLRGFLRRVKAEDGFGLFFGHAIILWDCLLFLGLCFTIFWGEVLGRWELGLRWSIFGMWFGMFVPSVPFGILTLSYLDLYDWLGFKEFNGKYYIGPPRHVMGAVSTLMLAIFFCFPFPWDYWVPLTYPRWTLENRWIHQFIECWVYFIVPLTWFFFHAIAGKFTSSDAKWKFQELIDLEVFLDKIEERKTDNRVVVSGYVEKTREEKKERRSERLRGERKEDQRLISNPL